MDIKTNTDLELARFPSPALHNKEIDLLALLDTLLAAKKRIISVVLAFMLAGLAVAWLMPQKWTSQAVITPAEQIQWNDVQQMQVALQVLGVDVKLDRTDAFNLFLKKFQSRTLLEEYVKSSSYVMSQLGDASIDPQELHRAVVALAEKMKAVDNAADKKGEKSLYTAWTLSFTAPTAGDAQTVLEGYIAFISALVEKETMQNVRNAVSLKAKMEEERLDLERVRLTNIHNTNIQRLNYSLEVANAAGIKKPVYSNGQAVKDDPDYSIALGADGIAQKLAIEKSLKDVAELNADFQNREYQLAQLKKLSVQDVSFEPFKYQLSPSMPVKKDGPGKALIILLFALLGGIIACGGVLLRTALSPRSPLTEAVMP
jgi:LPS O-antigen subunit length determinant protein (WzzB/FepE family)